MRDETGYLNMLSRIVEHGNFREVDGEEPRHESFGETLTFDLTNGRIPLLTTKKVFFKSLAAELLWFIGGEQNIQSLRDAGVKIWDAWADDKGVVGPLYGYQWRHWQVDPRVPPNRNPAKTSIRDKDSVWRGREIDQLKQVMDSLRYRPEARSHVMTNWRPDHLECMAIKPCHGIHIQFYRYGDELSLLMTQRSH